MRESQGNVEVRKGWAAVVVQAAVVKVNERAVEYFAAEVLVDAVAEMRRDIANDTPEDCKIVGVDVVVDIAVDFDLGENEKPNVKRQRRCSHAPAVEVEGEGFDGSTSSYHHMQSRRKVSSGRISLYARCCTSSGPIRSVEKCGGDRALQSCAAARDLKTSSLCDSLLGAYLRVATIADAPLHVKMSTMITFAANNEFFRKRKRACEHCQCAT
jgi:hypothetical protein